MDIITNADGFFRAAERCSRIEKEGTLFIPEFVNLGLACELYLKAILQANKIESKLKGKEKHDISKLYNELTDQIKTGIGCEYIKARKKSVRLTEKRLGIRTGSITTLKKKPHKVTQEAIDAEINLMLPEIATTFVDWRYIHEKKLEFFGINSGFFYDFALALKQYSRPFAPKDKK